ncbi:hemagglutinin-neuraminidase [giant squirrel virus]|uniref:Hemagglutinin-neuraminidase n=1 Tax=giant squirrel virus TaxID=2847092 RepID=A0A383S9L8_9MONO|nr:hemagglutinin-neuraminidase [giant squirrel virus]SYZ47180.1 hemagglutinin-neuraminidase [giant squirrel virus]
MDKGKNTKEPYWTASSDPNIPGSVSDELHLNRSLYKSALISTTQLTISLVVLVLSSIIVARQSSNIRDGPAILETVNISHKEMKEAIMNLIRQEVIARSINIQSSVQTGIPVLLNKNTRDIIQTVGKSCNRQELTQLCESTIAVHHADGITPLNPHEFWRCPAGEPYLGQDPEISLLPGPSLLSGSTTISGCVRLPSLSIGDTIYAYSSNLITQGCANIGKSYQVLQLGYISLNSDMFPDLNPVVSHTYDINDNRKSCSVIAAGNKGYQLCSMPKVDERADYASDGIEDLVLDVLDLKGRTRSHRYKNRDINFDHPFSSLYPSVGSGVALGQSLIFLGYGGLTTPLQGNTKCNLRGCRQVSQETCNEALKVTWLGGRQIVNAIISVTNYLSDRPRIEVTTIPITQNYLGAEGRLLKLGDKIYIYTRSSGWHSQLQIGVLDMGNPLTITWTTHEFLSRPGNAECNWYNTCPKECISGVYTDAYPLSPDAANVATVTLYANTSRVNPTIMYSNTTNAINMLRIQGVDLEAAYTTTSCVTHFGKGYCFHIIEINQKSLNTLQPMLFKTSIPKLCNVG